MTLLDLLALIGGDFFTYGPCKGLRKIYILINRWRCLFNYLNYVSHRKYLLFSIIASTAISPSSSTSNSLHLPCSSKLHQATSCTYQYLITHWTFILCSNYNRHLTIIFTTIPLACLKIFVAKVVGRRLSFK